MRVYGVLCLFGAVAMGHAQSLPDKVDFIKEVHPVLTEKCRACHLGEGGQAGLQVQSREDLLRGGKSGPAMVPGNGAESLLVLMMQGKRGLTMPPSGPPVSLEVIERIRLWIDQGAKFEEPDKLSQKTAPLAPRTPALPPGTSAHPVDRFLDAYFAKRGVKPPTIVPDALFARRAWLDITGLPPSPEELRKFVADTAANKRTRLVDQLLADRRNYAEHWISFWNDLLRNDEGVIYHGERKSITDWLLASLERNAPYNEMVRSLLDPQPQTGPEGFLVGVSWRGVISASQTPPMQAAQNAAQVFLGVNLKCAACHDSFINRWKLRDTYGLASLFSDQPLELVRCDVPLGKTAEAKFPFSDLNVSFDNTLASKRKAAAEWFVHPENGRFARTLVNRYWKQLLGRGIVEPADDMDAEAWSQDLLDWLASDFVAHNYDLQHLMRRIMTSRAYQMQAIVEQGAPKQYVFQGPRLRRVTAEQFEDAVSMATGHWRVYTPKANTYSEYAREWRRKSDPLSRAMGRPIRDQVYTERSTEATTLQALEMMNGPLLSQRLARGAATLLGQAAPVPANLFDSKGLRANSVPVDIDITGTQELWLVMEDVGSYDPSRVLAGWANPELVGPGGTVKLDSLPAQEVVKAEALRLQTGPVPAIFGKVPSMLVWNIQGKGFTRFKALAAIDERSRKSDIGPLVRFFVFKEKPNPDQLMRVEGKPLYQPPHKPWTSTELVDRLYTHLLMRTPTAGERKVAVQMLGGAKPTAAGTEDLLWALLMSPEFQFVH